MLINVFIGLLLTLLAPATSNRINYVIIEKSSLTISGSSNVNEFECTTYDNLSEGYVITQKQELKRNVDFSNAILRINVKSFDCHNPMLNKDFYKTLNAKDSPTIDVELLSALPMIGDRILNRNKGEFKASVAITLNGTSRSDEIIVAWEKVSKDIYRFRGIKELKMSDFRIEKPVAALGLIKVNDEITIDFDLYIQSLSKNSSSIVEKR